MIVLTAGRKRISISNACSSAYFINLDVLQAPANLFWLPRLEVINKCFSKETVEEVLQSLVIVNNIFSQGNMHARFSILL
jgi:hypothetical protein